MHSAMFPNNCAAFIDVLGLVVICSYSSRRFRCITHKKDEKAV